jgi:hypothetical protein
VNVKVESRRLAQPQADVIINRQGLASLTSNLRHVGERSTAFAAQG